MYFDGKEQKVKITRQSHKCLFIKISDFYEASVGDVIGVTMRVHDVITSFIALVKRYHKPSYGVNIPEFLVKKYGIRLGEFIEIKNIHKIKPVPREKKLTVNEGRIDFLSLIPERTRKNQKIYVSLFLKDGEEWIRVWNPRVIKQPELRRYVDLKSFGYLLGQLQAEGVKFQNNKTPFLSFTNVLIDEHNDFIESLRTMGIDDQSIIVQFSFNSKRISSAYIENYKTKFMEITGIPVKTCVHQKRGYYKFRIYVYSSLFTEIILNAMNKVRKTLTESDNLNNDLQVIAENFLAKLLTGDGSFRVYRHKKRRSHNISGKITDKDINCRSDYAKILQRLGFKTRDDGISVHFSCGIKNLIFLYKIKAFKGTRNWNKILHAIEIHCKGKTLRGKSLFRLTKLVNYDVFTLGDLYKHFNCSQGAIRTWLSTMRKEGYIKKTTDHYYLTTKGREIGILLNDWLTELNKIKI